MYFHRSKNRSYYPGERLEFRVPARARKGFFGFSILAIFLAALAVLPILTASFPAEANTASEDDLLAVDCLLPGQIRQLGRKTYLGPRRPIKTTASDCSIRGGEYVAYDRASYATALKVWLPLAREGDIEAIVNVGEIYEKGLGLAPDYQAAAHWYRLAAEKGSASAQINLGHLYEKGLGVDRDPAMALNWYRMASGLTNSLELDPGTTDQPVSLASTETADSRIVDELAHLQAESKALREQLEATGKQLESANRALTEKSSGEDKSPAPVAVNPEIKQKNQRLEADLKAKEDTINALKMELDRRRGEAESLQSKYDVVTDALAGLRTELVQNRRDAATYRDQLEQAKAALSLYQQSATTKEEEVARLTQLWKHSEAVLDHQQEEMQRLQLAATELEKEANRYRAQIAEQEVYDSAIKQGKLAGPNITMIDPTVEETRGSIPTIRLRGKAESRQIIGRLEAPAGLLSLTVNDQPSTINEQGVFQAFVARDKAKIPVSVIAIDRQGKQDTVEFILETETAGQQHGDVSAMVNSQSLPPPVDFGTYHALVIGIDDYRSLPKLRTAVRDAKAVSEVLENRYGFRVSTLLNASRYDILSALNDLRQRLTSEDNLLIYYAGHGELDKINMRGHWLPRDAEPGNSANWLSNVAITDILNIINARQILVIADSCYSGSLTRSALTQPAAGALTEQERLNWLKSMAKKRSRTVLTSGGLEPTLDGGGGGHSVFARALIDVLSGNSQLIEGRELYQQVSARVAYAASRIRFEQVPEYAPIQHTGHEGGDFFLVPAL